jgi:hypothetical protein
MTPTLIEFALESMHSSPARSYAKKPKYCTICSAIFRPILGKMIIINKLSIYRYINSLRHLGPKYPLVNTP